MTSRLSRGPAADLGARAAIFVLSAAVLLAASPATAQDCRYDRQTQSFAGDAKAQARCLLRPLRAGGALAAPTDPPATLLNRVETAPTISRASLSALIATLPDPYNADLEAALASPMSQTAAGLEARYFVIHDTSYPYFGGSPFPADFDTNAQANRLRGYLTSQAVAHMFVNRLGEIGSGHDFRVPWRATRLEMQVAGTGSRGRFLHIELVQPRRRDPDPRYHSTNDRLSPTPGFTQAQYDSLALLYTVASVRAGQWLIPAFHANVDRVVPGGHDDPQGFDIAAFEASIQSLLGRLGT